MYNFKKIKKLISEIIKNTDQLSSLKNTSSYVFNNEFNIAKFNS